MTGGRLPKRRSNFFEERRLAGRSGAAALDVADQLIHIGMQPRLAAANAETASNSLQ